MRRTAIWILALAIAAPALAQEELSKPAEKVLASALRMAKGSRVTERNRDKLVEEAGELSDEDLSVVVARIRAEAAPLNSLPEIRLLLTGMYVTRRWGEEAATRFPDLLDRWELSSKEAQRKLLLESLRLEDLRLAVELVVRYGAAPIPAVRARAALAAACLITWGEATDAVRLTLTTLLDDPDPAVRVLAIRAGFQAQFDPAYPAAVARLDDGVAGPVEVDGAELSLRPGEEALERLGELTRLDLEFTWSDFTQMTADQKESVRNLLLTWWREKGDSFPVPGWREAAFRPVATERQAKVIDDGETRTSFQFWAGLDRTRIRLTVQEIELFATSAEDWRVHWHARYMAQGMRSDDGELWIRHQPVGEVRVLARKAIGCYVLSFQPLFDGRLKVRMAFHDPPR